MCNVFLAALPRFVYTRCTKPPVFGGSISFVPCRNRILFEGEGGCQNTCDSIMLRCIGLLECETMIIVVAYNASVTWCIGNWIFLSFFVDRSPSIVYAIYRSSLVVLRWSYSIDRIICMKERNFSINKSLTLWCCCE